MTAGAIGNQKPIITIDKLREESNYYVPFALIVSNLIILVARYIWCLYWIEGKIFCSHPLYLIPAAVLPFAVWCCSTLVEKYNFYRTKFFLLFACIVNAFLTLMQPLWWVVYDKIIRKILNIRITEAFTPNMVVMLARITFILTFVIAFLVVGSPVFRLSKSGELREKIEYFKLNHIMDLRPNRYVAYDLRIMKDMRGSGRIMPLYEEDLYTHIALIGPSGTGKTSSSILPMFICFLDRKIENREKREKLLLKMLEEKKAYIQGPLAQPTEYDIIPFKAYEKERQQIYKDYPDCGVTFVSPNESLGDDVVKLCEKCGVSVNILDPTKKYEQSNVNMVSMQPFHVPLGLSSEDLAVSIVNQAKIFSETLITVNEASGEGGGEQYFRDLNTSVTSNIAIICMLYRNLRKEQTDIGEIRRCINEFHELYPMMQFINDKMQLGVEIVNPVEYKEQQKMRKQGGGNIPPRISNNPEGLGILDAIKQVEGAGVSSGQNGNEAKAVDDNDAEYYGRIGYLSSSDHSDETVEAFTYALRYVNKELFMSEDKMYDQARGLRNLINDILAHPQVYRVLRGSGRCIDIDRALSRCEITVVNTAIKISQQASTSLGLFFLLNHKRSVLRRPMGDRQMQALVVDEATQYVHPWMEDAIGLYRQYHCFCTFSFQSLAQMDKTNRTKYIEGILLTVGNLIVYGRVGVKEMEIFEKMGGSKKITQLQEQSSRTSIFADTPSATTGGRLMEADQSSATATSLRVRGFQEVTWIGTVEGDVQYAKIAKLSFANVDKKTFDKGAEPFDFSDYVTDGAIPVDDSLEKNNCTDKEPEQETGITEQGEKEYIIDADDDASKQTVQYDIPLMGKDKTEIPHVDADEGEEQIQGMGGGLERETFEVDKESAVSGDDIPRDGLEIEDESNPVDGLEDDDEYFI